MLKRGAEKIVINTAAHRERSLISRLSAEFGSQSVVVSIDVKRNWFGRCGVVTNHAIEKTPIAPEDWAVQVEQLGAGEILLTSVDRDGTFSGYDTEMTTKVVSSVSVPVIACGGAGKLEDVRSVVNDAGASAAAAGSLFVFRSSQRAVLINYPGREILDGLFS